MAVSVAATPSTPHGFEVIEHGKWGKGDIQEKRAYSDKRIYIEKG